MKREGNITLGLTSGLMLLISIFLFTMFQPLLEITVATKNIENDLTENITEKTGLERVYSQLINNISYEGSLIYEDIDKTYEISTLESVDRIVNLSDITSFEVNNATDINITLNYNKIDETADAFYNIRIIYDNEVIKVLENVNESVVVNIPTDFLYLKETDETNYGVYEIETVTNNCEVFTQVEYKELDYRLIQVKEGEKTRNFVAENDTSTGGKKQVYMKGDGV